MELKICSHLTFQLNKYFSNKKGFACFVGFGGSLIFTPAYVIVGQYFSKKKGKAMAISTLGSGLGTVAIAPLISVMLEYYAYPGAMLITGALIMNNCITAALYRPVEDNFPKKTKVKSEIQELTNVVENGESSAIGSEREVKAKSVKKLEKFKKNFIILKNPTFFLYCIEITAMSIAIQTFLTFLPGLAKEYKAASDKEAAFLLSIMGIADMCGRLLIGFLMDLKRVSISLWYSLINNSQTCGLRSLLWSGLLVMRGQFLMSSYSSMYTATTVECGEQPLIAHISYIFLQPLSIYY